MSTGRGKHAKPSLGRVLLQFLLMQASLAALLFLPAGSWRWPQAWALFIACGFFLVLIALWELYRDPEQMRERGRIAPNVKGWDKIIMATYNTLFLVMLAMPGLDVVRFGWSKVPAGIQVGAWAGLALAAAVIFWAVKVNTYLSRFARIQDDRGHAVVSSGPYRFVRHPMYLGNLLLFLCLGPALGSFYTLFPGAAIMILFVIRTAKEDRMLREELPGYTAYAARVRYRLMPGLW